MNNWEAEYKEKLSTASQAVRLVRSGDTVYIGSASGVAYELTDALTDISGEVEDITIASGLCIRPMRAFEDDRFHHITYFLGPEERKALANGVLDYSSIHLHDWNTWIERIANIDVAFLEVTPPDENGYMNLGTNGAGLGPGLIRKARTVVLSVNRYAAWVEGPSSLVHVSDADAIVESDTKPGSVPEPKLSGTINKISEFIVAQVPDGATIQLGAGRLGTAIGYGLMQKNDLGVHTELISDSIMRLMQNGNVTNKKKTYYPNKTVIGFAMGSQKLYEFLDHNEDCIFLPLEEVNNPVNIAKNDNMISVNGAVEIDLFGQVSAETIDGVHFSGIGGQVDYVRGAQMSRGGKSFIAAESTFRQGNKTGSRIVTHLSQNAVVTTSRADVHYVVTEFGCVDLKSLCMRDRVKAMISIAHPDFREQLTEDAKRNHWI